MEKKKDVRNRKIMRVDKFSMHDIGMLTQRTEKMHEKLFQEKYGGFKTHEREEIICKNDNKTYNSKITKNFEEVLKKNEKLSNYLQTEKKKKGEYTHEDIVKLERVGFPNFYKEHPKHGLIFCEVKTSVNSDMSYCELITMINLTKLGFKISVYIGDMDFFIIGGYEWENTK